MAAEGQSVGQHPSSFSLMQNVQKNVFSVSEAMPTCSKNSKSDSGSSRNGMGFLHEPDTNDYASKTSVSTNSEEKSIHFRNSVIGKVAMDGTAGAVSKSIHSISSSNCILRPFDSVNKFQGPQQSHGRLPFRDAKGQHLSAKIPSHSNQAQGREFIRNPENSSELARGPRANRIHFPPSAEKNHLGPCIRRDQYNKSDFQTNYEQAKFFMIKSYSEDDIHKSIKFSVWASTINGNQKLEAAFRNAETIRNEKGTKCPVFLFFSVNASGQFVGLAEMIGPFDVKQTMDFWQNDKWNGFFPVKWHIIKDIPNKYFQNIRLENNYNRPVTFSRDTQEIALPQGLKMLQFFKSYPLARSLLDDFEFYENRAKSLNGMRNQQPLSHSEVNRDYNSSMMHVDARFDRMNISRSRRPSYGPGSSSTNIPRIN